MTEIFKRMTNLLFLLCLAACSGKSDVVTLLREAEMYMDERPDSALCLLDSVKSMGELTGQEHALWCLLYTQAQDKNRIEHTSDSLIQIAVKYYEGTDLEDRKMQAYYYCGRVFQDLSDAPQAQGCYLKAYEVGKNLNNNSLLGRLCANLGTLYTYQDLYQPALNFQKEAVNCFIQDEDTVSLSMTLRNIARIYVCENQLDSAIVYYSKALSCTSDSHELYMFNELADLYGRIGDYEKGLFYAQKAYAQIETTDDSYLVSLTLGDLYLKLGKIDSAYHYLSFCRKSTDVYTLKDTYHSLSQLEKFRGNLNAYVLFLEKYEALRDSIEKQAYKETLIRLQSMYDYQLVEKEKEYYRQKADRKTNYLKWLSVGAVFFLFVIGDRYFHLRKKKEVQQDQLLRLQEQQTKESEKYQEERNSILRELEQRIKREEDLVMQLDMVNEVIKDRLVQGGVTSDMKEIYKKNFLTSDLYRGLASTWNSLDLEQWPEIVKRIDHVLYPDFTYRLKMMYPRISEKDLQISCMTKLEIPVSRMAVLFSRTSQSVSLYRKRLYTKLTNKEGSVQDFDEFISSF